MICTGYALAMPRSLLQEMRMENSASYSISEAAEVLKLSAKTIRRYIKSGKLPSVKVPTKFGDEYRITAIPEELKQEAAAQAQSQAGMDVVSAADARTALDAQSLYQENMRLAAQLGAATERMRQMEEQLKLQESQLGPFKERIRQLEDRVLLLAVPKTSPQLPWWKRLFGIKPPTAENS
jgi:MerR family copper efflux transcriptional regulator